MNDYVAFAKGKQPVIFPAKDDVIAMREAELIWSDCWAGITVFRCNDDGMTTQIGYIPELDTTE